MSKIVIAGAGIAGLSAGIYAVQSGFDVTIYESHSIPGGASTSWRRKGYFFEGGIHWMVGTDKASSQNQIWEDLGALRDTKIHYREPFLTVDHFGEEGYLYRDLKKLRAHFLEISPEDRDEIEQFCKDLKKFSRFRMPLKNIKGVKLRTRTPRHLLQSMAILPAIPRFPFYARLSTREYVARFQSPIIRALLEHAIGPGYSAIALMFNLAILMNGDGGYPQGGSLAMTRRMADYFEQLGGTIHYSQKVEKVVMDQGVCKGIVIDGNTMFADAVILTPDTRMVIDHFFDKPLEEAWAVQMRATTKPMLNTFICLGIEADLSELPEAVDVSIKEPFSCGGIEYDYIPVYNYAGYEGYAPEGCTAVTSIMSGDSYDYWKKTMEAGTYEQEKERVALSYIKCLEEKYPQIKGKTVVWDVATPLTYERYLGSYKGSWMSVVEKGERMESYPCKPERMEGVYLASQRLSPPGGLSGASESGRLAVQHLCKDLGVKFQGTILFPTKV